MNAYLLAMRYAFTFTGRTSRAQYWPFVLVVTAILFVAAVLDNLFGTSPEPRPIFVALIGVVHLVPFIAASVRRLHDADFSGWLYLINGVPFGQLVFIVLTCMPSTPRPNRYGAPVIDPDAERWSLDSFKQAPAVEPSFERQRAPAASPTPVQPTAAPTAPHSPARSQTSGLSANLLEELERLAALRTNGVIDEAEFAALKAKLLPGTSFAAGEAR